MSPTLAIDERVRELTAAGERIISFGPGQPDAPTPENVCAAGVAAIGRGETRYTSPGGSLELRQAISRKLERDNGIRYAADQIVVSAGAKQSIYMALSVLVDPGDEVLIPSPYWVSYPAQVEMLGGTVRVVTTDESTGFKLTPDHLERSLNAKSRCLILNSPSNPTGAVYSRQELEALAAVIEASDLYVITDEIYERIIYDDAEHVSLASLSDLLRERTAVVNGVSKAYSMTGWRIGYFAATQAWAKKATALQSHLCGNPCSISQSAAIEALDNADGSVNAMVGDFARRRSLVLDWVSKASDLKLAEPPGAFYVFPDFSGYYGRSAGGPAIGDDIAMASYLIDEARVAFVPGSAFGSSRHLRISYALSDDMINEGLAAMVDALNKLH
jgi:aspartate aminotransferase